MRKYRNQKAEVDGYKFDSKKEAKHYQELKMKLRVGMISELVLQPKFLLQDAFEDYRAGITKTGKPMAVRAITYTADFSYIEYGKLVVVDVKSPATRKDPSYVLKKKLLLYKYKNFIFREV